MGGYPSAEKEEDAGVDDHIFNNPNQGSGDANGPRGTATVKGQSSEEHDQVFHLKVPPGVPPGGKPLEIISCKILRPHIYVCTLNSVV